MAISDRIQSMYTNVGEVYDTITNVSLPEHKNIENIPSAIRDSYLEIMNNGIDVIWDNWEKVVGEGTSLTLSNTVEAPMKLELKGNTSQETTTGKNLLNSDLLVKSSNSKYFNNSSNPLTLSAGTYTVSFKNPNASYAWKRFAVINGTPTAFDNLSGSVISYSFTLTAESSVYIQCNSYIGADFVEMTDAEFNNIKSTIMLEAGSTPTSYEPYTNGASPNPDFPMPVHVVSGDNEVEVVGKNLANPTTYTTYTFPTTNTPSINYGTVNLVAGTTYYFSYTIENATTSNTRNTPFVQKQGTNTRIYQYTTTNQNLTAGRKVWQFTVEETATYEYGYWCHSPNVAVTVDNMMISTSSDTTYEPYTSNTYHINLPVENLFTFGNLTEETRNGVIKTITGSKINLNGTTTSATDIVLRTNTGVHLQSGTYTYTLLVNGTITIPSGSNTSLLFTNSSNTNVFNGTMVSLKANGKLAGTFTLNAETDLYLQIYSNASGQAFDCNLYCQIEEGTKVNSYTPYGTTPIELCKIGDYKDRFFKTSGKNLFDKDNANVVNLYINTSGEILTASNGKSIYIECEPSTTYTVSRIAGKRFRITDTSVLPANGVTGSQFVGTDTASKLVITTNLNSKYLVVNYYTGNSDTLNEETIRNSIMIQKGNIETPQYEPYGTGWYLEKKIGKVVLNGSETLGGSSANGYYYALNEMLRTNDYRLAIKSNYYTIGQDYRSGYHEDKQMTGYYVTTQSYPGQNWLYIFDTSYSDKTALATWLSTHNTIVYYVLATPTYTKIEGTLASQLEEVYRAKSKEGQTNISQVNNDLPFVLDVSALKEI